jgi:P-type Ca2+ transporter type 2C
MIDFYTLSVKDCFKELKTSSEGLSAREAASRLLKNGPNEFEHEKISGPLVVFARQFNNPFIYILIFAGAVSFALAERTNALVIFSAVMVNVFIGFFQENKANRALSKLKGMVERQAIVRRGGQEDFIDARGLVPGDIIIIEAGNRLPADGRLILAGELAVDEAILTGESFPAEKKLEILPPGASLPDRKNMVYASTAAVSGRGEAVITATGSKTEVGKIAGSISGAEEKTPLQLQLLNLSKILGLIFLSVCFLIFILGVIQGRDIFEMFLIAVALAVSSIPEGLLIAMTLILVLGMQRLLKNKVLTRKLVAAETLGGTTVICSDKTGTLTFGKMSVSHIVVGENEFEVKGPEKRAGAEIASLVLQIGALCNNARVENPDEPLKDWRFFGAPTETALLLAAYASGLDKKEIEKKEPRVAEKQFASENKFMITVHRRGENFILYEKGAPEVLLAKSGKFYEAGREAELTAPHRQKILRAFENLTKKGFRVVGAAWREVGGGEITSPEKIDWSKIDADLVFAGLIALKDPLRPDAAEAIAEAKKAGVRPVIITGDHRLTALAIGREIGMNLKEEEVITGEDLDKIDDKELIREAGRISVYARVSPHHKLRIINALRSRGEVVAMTGDGVNDAPALKAADIGIALGTGTDVAREASDMILLDNDFKVIVLAVEEGRKIFANLRKVITYLVSDAASEIVLVAGSILLNAPLAIIPVQILWLNIIHDGPPDFALAFEKGNQALMEKKPRGRATGLFNGKMKAIIFTTGVVMNLMIFSLFFYLLSAGAEINYLRTLIFAVLGAKSLLMIFSLRSLSRPIWRFNPFGNLYLLGAIAISAVLFIAAIYWPPLRGILSTVSLSAKDWLVVSAFAAVNLILVEAVKIFFIAREKKNNK